MINTRVRTALALGLPNIVRAARYRLGVRLGTNPACRLSLRYPRGPFFSQSMGQPHAWTP